MKSLQEMTLQELVDHYNSLTGGNLKKFESKEVAIRRIQQYMPKQVFTPKQLEVRLNMNSLKIRKLLRKTFPDMAKKGQWKITEDMITKLLKEKNNGEN